MRTLTTTCDHLRAQGHEVLVISPDQFSSVACPTYPEIRLALALPGVVGERLRTFAPEAIHIATEGPLGMAARGYCTRRGIRFTTAYHTQFPDYLASRTHLPAQWFWRYIEWFHRPARRVLEALEQQLRWFQDMVDKQALVQKAEKLKSEDESAKKGIDLGMHVWESRSRS